MTHVRQPSVNILGSWVEVNKREADIKTRSSKAGDRRISYYVARQKKEPCR